MTTTTTTTPSVLDTALAFHAAGISVIPSAIDGSKAPLGSWRKYQSERMSEDELRGWFASGHPGIGIVTGHISGELEMLELEGRAIAEGILPVFQELLTAAGLGDVWARIMAGYLEQTPSGGLHVLYRVTGGPAKPNTKLAERFAREDELTEDERRIHAQHPGKTFRRVLIETRGEGGFVVVAPSHGTTHPTGRPWRLLTGGPSTIATITAEERDALHQVARLLDQTNRPEPAQETLDFTQPGSTGQPEGAISPGDDFEARTDWADILVPHGWTHVYTRGRTRYWRRPGKNIGISATTGHADDRDRLYVFTTSTEFEPEVPYTKFGAFALLHYGGDHKAAAKALAAGGYGRPAPEQPRKTTSQDKQANPTTATTAVTVTSEPKTYSLTDDGNALRLVDEHAHQIRYCPQRGTWLVWDGHRWQWDHNGQIFELARAIARNLPAEDPDQRRHRRASLSARGLAAMVAVARTDPRIIAPLDQLDANPYQLNTPAGVVDLRTGQLHQPAPTALHVRSTTVPPDFQAHPERWLRFLETTFSADPTLIPYVQRLIGLSLVGAVLEQLLPFCWGEGANGKTTLLGVIQRLLGIGPDGYAISVNSDILLASHHSHHPTELAQLAGARLAVTSELEDGQRFAEARVKLLTGRDPISARFMRADFFVFRPTHTLWLLANHQPAVRVGGPAFWRRLRLIPFLHIVPPEERDPHLEDKLVDSEGPAILAWAIQGAAAYFQNGLEEPETVKAATDAYAKDQDNIARFVEEMCETGSPAAQHMCVRATDLRVSYETWCRGEGEMPASVKAFSLALQRRWGVIVERTAGGRVYRGIRLRDPSSNPSQPGVDPSSAGVESGRATPPGGNGW